MSLEDLARTRNIMRKKVIEWMAAEGAQGNLRRNDEAPDWAAYKDAENALHAAIKEVGEEA